MATQRQYEAATIFGARIVDMRHLWNPSTEYKGQPTQKPNHFAMFIVPKTQTQWHTEPTFAGVAAACGKLFTANPHIIQWPVVDGDMPSPEGKSSEFAKGHWLFSASTSNAPNVELVQAGGQLVKLQNKVGVKSGDFTMVGVTAAVKKNDPRGVKLYLNAVVFTAPGEEIVFANSVSGAELMAQAQAQGLRPTGFAGSPGGGFGPTTGGFAPPNGNAPGGAFGNPATPAAPGQFGTAGSGNATFPSSQPGAFPGAAAPRGPFG